MCVYGRWSFYFSVPTYGTYLYDREVGITYVYLYVYKFFFMLTRTKMSQCIFVLKKGLFGYSLNGNVNEWNFDPYKYFAYRTVVVGIVSTSRMSLYFFLYSTHYWP